MSTRGNLKLFGRAVCKVLVLPLTLAWHITGSRVVFAAAGQCLATVPGVLGVYLRVAFYSSAIESVSSDICIGFGTLLAHPEVSIGRGVYIGAYCMIGMAEIGEHGTIGSHVNILSGSRQHRFDALDIPIQDQGGSFEVVRIGRNCWIGNGAIVMNHLGVQNVVGAGSVVTKATGDYEIVAGNPAKCIKKLTDAESE